jgi:hypothetical protein
MCRKLTYSLCIALVLGLVGSANGQLGKGKILFEWFEGTTGGTIDQLVDGRNPNYPNNPTTYEWRSSFLGPVNRGDNFGTRVRGYLYPPADGNYTFWIYSDDHSRLWLSTNDDPANKKLICEVNGYTGANEWTTFPEQKSSPITLKAGQRYYIEALHRDGTGGDLLGVGWGGPAIGAGPVIIDGAFLAAYLRAVDFMAGNPDPLDSAKSVTSPLVKWTAGLTASMQDVYFGTNPTPGPGEYKGRQTYLLYFHTDGLISGTTYYWRVDEVEADGTTIYTGKVWSFTVPVLTAYDPKPADGVAYVYTDVDLTWGAGFSAIFHDVYFGSNASDVTNGTGGTFKIKTADETYDPGALTPETTYYWRIDEVEADNTTKYPGEVWSFKTRPVMPVRDPNLVGWWKLDDVGSGKVTDFSGYNLDGTIYGNPLWVAGYDGGAMSFAGSADYVSIDGYKGVLRISTDLQHAFTCAAWIRTNGNGEIMGWGQPSGRQRVEFRVDGNRLRVEHGSGDIRGDTPLNDSQWHHVAAVVPRGAAIKDVLFYIDGRPDPVRTMSSPDNKFNITSNYDVKLGRRYNADERWLTGLIDDARIYDKALTQAEIQQIMVRPDPLLAWKPSPPNALPADVEHAALLSWSPGDNAAQHDVYFGADSRLVGITAADTSDTTGIYRGRQASTSYTPPEALQEGQTYYWRVDEYKADATISKGKVWSFTLGDYLIVDDFEAYTDDVGSRIFQTWLDGWGFTEPAPGYAGNGTGSAVGYAKPPFAELTTIRNGRQSMPLQYVNDGSTGKARYSETQREWASPQDWTPDRIGIKALTLWFRGLTKSYGSFGYDAATGIYTITARGTDIWNNKRAREWGLHDEFHYVYKRLSGAGTIVVKALRVTNSNAWAKAGVMIRQTLDANSVHAMMVITPGQGVSLQYRSTAGLDSTSVQQTGIVTPQWIKLERDAAGNFTAYYSADGNTWTQIGTPINITMQGDVYIGLSLTSHSSGATCVAEFSDVITTGAVTGGWQSQDIGIISNMAEPLYVALQDSTGKVHVVNHPDLNGVLSTAWQEWNIDLQQFRNAGLNLASIKKMYLGLGNRSSPKAGGTGYLYVDDIRLYRPRCVASLAKPTGDFSNNCTVDYPDLAIIANNWLKSAYDVTPAAVSTAGLIAHYKLDGNANDSVGGHNGTAVRSRSYTTGKVGQAIDLDGIGDFVATDVNATDLGIDGNSPKTVTAWAYARSFNNGGIFDMGNNVNSQNFSVRTMTQPNTWRAQRYGYPIYDFDFTYPSANVWVHFALVYEGAAGGDKSWAYANGELVGSQIAMLDTADTRPFAIGVWSNNYFDGLIDDVRIYNRALSQAEVADLAGRTGTFSQPLYLLLTPQDAGMNMYDDGTINLADYALLVDMWLDELLWP